MELGLLNPLSDVHPDVEYSKLKPIAAVVRYKERALKYVKMLEEHIATDVAAGRSTAAGTLSSWSGFDVMRDFVLRNSFNMLQNREWHSMIVRLREALDLLDPLIALGSCISGSMWLDFCHH